MERRSAGTDCRTHPSSPERDGNHRTIAQMTIAQVKRLNHRMVGRMQAEERVRELPATRLRRALREAAPHRVVASLNPLAPDTGLRHRKVREIDGRTDEAPGRDDKDVGDRSFSCGVSGKRFCFVRWLGGRGESSREYRSSIYSCRCAAEAAPVQEWYYPPSELSSKGQC
jgi:hypothetical protein